MVLRRFRWVASVGLALVVAACGGRAGDASEGDGGVDGAGVRARFDPSAAPMRFGAIPWPDTLYRDDAGSVRVAALPGREQAPSPAYFDALRSSLSELDGFAALPTMYFWFDGQLDTATLPQQPSETVREDASVFLMDVDPASPEAFRRIPIDIWWHGESRRLALRPADGHPLVGGRRYAAVVTSDVEDANGHPLRPDEDFVRIRDASVRPTGKLLDKAYGHYAPVLASIGSNGVATERIVSLAVFRVQSVARDLRDARTMVWDREAPVARLGAAVPAGEPLDARLGIPTEDGPGIDNEGGVQHNAIGWMIQGRFESPNFLSRLEATHGRFTRDADGTLVLRRLSSVPFTLLLPRGADLEALRAVLFQHGLGGDRSEALAVANRLAEAGWAVLAIDAPFHGMRSPRREVDTENRFTGVSEPDGFGDLPKRQTLRDFVGTNDERGELVPFHPVYLRDALRQTVIDLFAALRLVRDGDWSRIRAASPKLGELGFAASALAYVGHSLGAMVGAPFVAFEPKVGSAVLATGGGDLTKLLTYSPRLHALLFDPLMERLGEDPTDVDYRTNPPFTRPQFAIWQMLLDRGDPLSLSTTLRETETDVLFMIAGHDETVHSAATEALANVGQAAVVDAEAQHVDLMSSVSPVRNNRTIDGTAVTRGMTVFAQGTHEMLVRRHGQQRYRSPLEPPFERIEAATIANPTRAALGQLMHFVESWRGGVAEITTAAR